MAGRIQGWFGKGSETSSNNDIWAQGQGIPTRLKELKMQTLEQRRLRYDLIQVYKIMYNCDDVDRAQFYRTVGEE